MSAEKSGGSLSVAAVGGSADSDVVIDSAAIMSFFSGGTGSRACFPAEARRAQTALAGRRGTERRPPPAAGPFPAVRLRIVLHVP
jgi:hypothetical protein